MTAGRHTAQAALLTAPGEISVEAVEFDGPGQGQVLVGMRAAGVCHTDMHIHDSPDGWGFEFPMLLGHEGSGVVLEVGDGVSHLAAGDHVVIGCRVPCGNCPQCSRGNTRLCQASSPRAPAISKSSDGGVVNSPIGVGLFASVVPVDALAAVRVDRDVPLESVALLGCAVMTGTGAVLHSSEVWAGARVAVVGCGGVGLAAIQGARLANAAQVIAVDVQERKLEWARQLGATDTVDASQVDPVQTIRDLTDGLGVDFSFEAVGAPECAEQCIEMLAYGGVATLIGVPQSDSRITVNLGGWSPGFFKNTNTITVTHGGGGLPAHDLPLFTQLYREGKLDLDAMVTHRVGLDELAKGFDHMVSGDSIRTIVSFDRLDSAEPGPAG